MIARSSDARGQETEAGGASIGIGPVVAACHRLVLGHHRWYLLCMDVSTAADRVRLELRNAGFQEFEPGRRGFLAEGDPNGGWVSVRCHPGLPWARKRRDRDLQKYRDILAAAGFTVTDSPWVSASLRVTLPQEDAEI